MRLSGTTAIVTGASAGLGRAIAEGFVAEGARVACASRGRDRLEAAVAEFEGPGEAVAVTADVRSWESVRDMVAESTAVLGPVDVLVNNAGTYQLHVTGGTEHPVVDVPVEVWDTILETNLRGTFLCTKAVLGGMLERDAGRLIHVSTAEMSRNGRPGMTPYAVSKAGVEVFHRSLTQELADTGVESMVVTPGGRTADTAYTSYLDEEQTPDRAPGVIREPAVVLASGGGRHGGRYVATGDGDFREAPFVPE